MIRRFCRRLLEMFYRFLAALFYVREERQSYYENYRVPPQTLVTMGFLQRVLGFNRHVPWPVHFTSQVNAWRSIARPTGHGTPGWMPGCYIQALNGITFGESVFIGPGVKIISANHSLDDLTAHDPTPPIVIEDNCWIGANAVVLPGVHLGVGTIVGAGAVVTKSFAAGHCVIAGNPARIIRRLASTSDELRTDIVPNSETGI